MIGKIGALAPAFAALLTLAPARAAGVVVPNAERNAPFSETLPACDDAGVLHRIRDRFAQKESEYWSSSLTLGEIDRIAEIGYRANGLAYIPRRYCVARAQLNDLKPRNVIYAIQEDLGIIGIDYGVEWCVVGLDRNLAYAPGCQAVRPFLERNLGEKALRELF